MAKRMNPCKGASGRKRTLVKKAHELGDLPGFEVALFVRRRGRVTVYRSVDDESWWLVKADIDYAYPAPTNLLPHHFEKDLNRAD
ncbi:uncharacterized protein RAG0_07855 [Rhynchosporium agropyri]|uniref:MADS-box domain-containing protein n=1 Tax=Rhynchosporium agropyri TaxID=914238 RepID=A0A1E1KNC2_9HELO|nr:uncharacterized protein RAG0_07855 [Rhynchosporium agropyri]